MTPRIGFDVTSCAKPQRGGIGNYGAELIRACAVVEPDLDIVMALRPGRVFKRSLVEDILPGHSARVMFEARPEWTLGPLDAFHGTGTRLPRGGRFAKTFALHDINVFEFPELSTEAWRRTRRARIRQTIARADLIIVSSRQGGQAAEEHLDLPAERLRVVPLGVDVARFAPRGPEQIAAARAVLGLGERPYVLHVGGYSRRKNQDGLLEAFVRAALPEEWVLVLGGPRDDDAARLAARADELGLPAERVLLPGWVDDELYPALLTGAGLYVCASFHEGFGLPVLEAQGCGAPVLSSNRGALPETGGDAADFFDPEDLDDFAATLARLVGDTHRLEALRRRGPERVRAEYGWEQVARRTLAVLREALGAR